MSEPTEQPATRRPSVPSGRIWNRYEVSKSAGAVARGLDPLLDRPVAIKRLGAFSDADLKAIHLELAALRWLRIPGVVELIDHGPYEGDYVLVMVHVEGIHFLEGTGNWAEIAAPVAALLETLARVHAAGVVHADIKPANVILTPEGQPVLIDFGVSVGRSLGQDRELGGTTRYLAPERRNGVEPSPASDLYAVGVMLFEWLTGSPWEGRAEPVTRVAAPDDVLCTVVRLLQPDPVERPMSARATLAALGGSIRVVPTLSAFPTQPVHCPEALKHLFHGPDTFLHLQEDAARELWDVTSGDPDRIDDELERWLRSGLAAIEDDRVRVDRRTLAALAEARAPDVDPRSTGTALVRSAQTAFEALRQGRVERYLARSQAVATLALTECRRAADAAGEASWLGSLAKVSLADGSRRAVQLAGYQVDRTLAVLGEQPELIALRELLRAEEHLLEGAHGRALEVHIPPFVDPDLEIWRVGVLFSATLKRDHTEADALLDELEPWAHTPLRHSKWLGWRGNVRSQRSRFGEAMELYEAAAAGKRAHGAPLDAVLSSVFTAAAAAMEANELDRAAELAHTLRTQAAILRHPFLEAHGTWLERSVAYRRRDPPLPEPELVDAAGAVSPYLEAVFAMSEAANAWRHDHLDLAVDLGTRAQEQFVSRGARPAAVLMEAFLAMLRGTTVQDARSIAARTEPGFPVGLRIQTLGLLRKAIDRPPDTWTVCIRGWIGPRTGEVVHCPRELISFEEAAMG